MAHMAPGASWAPPGAIYAQNPTVRKGSLARAWPGLAHMAHMGPRALGALNRPYLGPFLSPFWRPIWA